MDTVVGCEGNRKVLLTLHFYTSGFMMAWLPESKESAGVEAVFDRMEKAIGTCTFSPNAKSISIPLKGTGSIRSFGNPGRSSAFSAGSKVTGSLLPSSAALRIPCRHLVLIMTS